MSYQTKPPLPRHRIGDAAEMRRRLDGAAPGGPVLPAGLRRRKDDDPGSAGDLKPAENPAAVSDGKTDGAPTDGTAKAKQDGGAGKEAKPADGKTADPKADAKADAKDGAKEKDAKEKDGKDGAAGKGGAKEAAGDGKGGAGTGGDADTDGGGGGASAPAADGGAAEVLPAPVLPPYRPPDLNAIRSPIVRPPPPTAVADTPKILKRTGSTPVQHHANIQAALFRVSESARKAQRDMTQEIESIAFDTRLSVEALAAQVDGIVERAAGTVAAAARAAYREVEALADARIKAIVKDVSTGHGDMRAREEKVRGLVVDHLANSGSGKIKEAQDALMSAYGTYAPKAAQKIPAIGRTGTLPEFIAGPGGKAKPPDNVYTPGSGEATTFAKRGEQILTKLHTAPTGAGWASYHRAYIDRYKAAAVPFLATEHQKGWVSAAEKRGKDLDSKDNRNRFFLTMMGLGAPTVKAMDADKEKYQKTLSDEIYRQHGKLSKAQERAVANIETTLRGPGGVRDFFDPAHSKSMPFGVIKGLRKTGAKMKQAMLDQALVLQANYRAGIAGMAAAYPDVVARLSDLLDGDDMLDERELVPRVQRAAASITRLRDGHIGVTRKKAEENVRQARDGFTKQVDGLREAVDKALASITENRQKAIFHFELTYSFFTGELGPGMKAALAGVTDYAEKVAKKLVQPVGAAKSGGTEVEKRAIGYFNGQIAGEWKGYIQNSVNKLDEAIGLGAGNKQADSAKPLPRIERDTRTDLNQRGEQIAVALPEPDVGGILGGSAIALLTPPPINVIAGGYAAYKAWSAIPSKSNAGMALAMPWPGPLALNQDMKLRGKLPVAQERVKRFMSDADADKPRVLGLFSRSEATAAQNKKDLIEKAKRFWGVNDDAVAALAKSFSPTELSTLSDAEKQAMQKSIRQNLSGAQFEITAAYIDGKPAKAAAIRIREDLARARRQGDKGMAKFGQDMDRLLAAELERSSGGYVPKEQLQQLTEDMYVEFAGLIPPKGGVGRETAKGAAPAPTPAATAAPAPKDTGKDKQPLKSTPVTAPPPANLAAAAEKPKDAVPAATEPAAASPAISTAGADSKPAAEKTKPTFAQDQKAAAAFRDKVAADAGKRADPAGLAAARKQFLDYATRDYAQAQYYGVASPWLAGAGDDRLSGYVTTQRGYKNAPVIRINDRRYLKAGLIHDRMDTSTAAMMAAYVNHGSSSKEYRQARAVQALKHAETRSSVTSMSPQASQDDIVQLSQNFGSPQLSLAKAKLADARNRKDERAIADAEEEVRLARQSHDKFLVQVAGQLTGKPVSDPPSKADIDAARALISSRVNKAGASFDPELKQLGDNLTSNGSIDLATGMRVATSGWGTYDNLLTEVTANRRRSEFDAYFAKGGQGDKDGISKASLGVGKGADWFGETSGDQAQALEIAFLGVPETAADHLEIANLKARHQLVDGTGLFAMGTMAGTDQKRELVDARAALGQRIRSSILANNDPHNPVPPEVRAIPASELIRPDGTLHPAARQYGLDRHGDFFGSGSSAADLSANVSNAAKNYSAEIGRQESFFTGLITAAAVVVSIVLLLIPGVNVAAAGVLTALIAGAATIAVKAGLRGNRYGWEEAAVDVARTGIEAATAGAGGALGGAVKPGAGALGKLASVGKGINQAFGRVGGAVVREGMTSAVSGVANTALDDNIWTGGVNEGIGQLFKAGLRGAAVGAVSGGVSESISGGVKGAFGTNRVSGVNGEGLTALGKRLSGTGREIVEEAISGMGGTAASELVNFLADVAEDRPGATFDNFLKKLGPALLKDLVSSGGRAAAKGHMKARYEAESARILAKDGPVSAADAALLRRLAISAGHEQYGRGSDEDAVSRGLTADASAADRFRADLDRAKAVLATLPKELQLQMRVLAPSDIFSIERIRDARAADDPMALQGVTVSLRENYPGVDPALMLTALRKVMRADRAAQAEVDAGVRKIVLARLPRAVRDQMADAPVDALVTLPRQLQAEAAKLIGNPDADPGALKRLITKAAKLDDSLDTARLEAQLTGLISGRPLAEHRAAEVRAKQLKDLNEVLPEALKATVDGLPAKDIAFLHRVALRQDAAPDAHVEGVLKMLGKRLPDLGEEAVGALVGTLLTNGRRQQADRAEATRAAQAEAGKARQDALMDNVPEDLRPLLAHLPDNALMELRRAQDLGPPMNAARMEEFALRAARDHPDLDGDALLAGMRRVQATPLPRRPFFERFRQRRALVSFVPGPLRGLVRRTPILSLPDAAFAEYVKSHADDIADGSAPRENAVTIRLNGEPVVLVREGADDFALREEGKHVIQIRDPAFAARLADLDEETLANWPMLPIDLQVRLATTVVDAEIAAHVDMIAALDRQAGTGFLARGRAAAATRLAALETRLATLQRSKAELSGLTPVVQLAIAAGLLPRPAILERPARLFSEEVDQNDGAVGEPQARTYDFDDPNLHKDIGSALESIADDRNSARNQPFADARKAVRTLLPDIREEFTGGILFLLNSLRFQQRANFEKRNEARQRGVVRVLAADDGLLKTLIGFDPISDSQMQMVQALLRMAGNEFAYELQIDPKAYTKPKERDAAQFSHYQEGLKSNRFLGPYTEMIKLVKSIDNPRTQEILADILVKFERETAGRRESGKSIKGHPIIRQKLSKFIEEMVKDHARSTPEKGAIEGRASSALNLSKMFSIREVRPPVDLADLRKIKGLATFADLHGRLLETLAKGEALPELTPSALAKILQGDAEAPASARENNLASVYSLIREWIDISGSPEEVAIKVTRALVHADHMMHGLESGRRLTPDAIERLLKSPYYLEFGSPAGEGKRTTEDIFGLKLPESMLDALRYMDQMLSQDLAKDPLFGALHQSKDELSSQTKSLLAALLKGSHDSTGKSIRLNMEGDGDLAPHNVSFGSIRSRTDNEAIVTALSALARARMDPETLKTQDDPLQHEKQSPEQTALAYAKKRPEASLSKLMTSKTKPDFEDEVSLLLSSSLTGDPRNLATAILKLATTHKVSEGKASMLLQFVETLQREVRLEDGDAVEIKAHTPDAYYVRITKHDGGELTGYISSYIRLLKNNAGDKMKIDIFNGERYVDITETVRDVRKSQRAARGEDAAASDDDFNLFRGLTDIFTRGMLPDLPAGARDKAYNDLVLAAYLMFGIEVIRHPLAETAAIMAIYVGARMSASSEDLTPAGLMLGNPDYRRSAVDVLKKYFGQNKEELAPFEDASANSLMVKVFEAQRNRLDLMSGGLFASSMVQYMSRYHKIDDVLSGKNRDVADVLFVDEILRRNAALFNLAANLVVREEIADLKPDEKEQLLSGPFNNDNLEGLMRRILAAMLGRISGIKIDKYE